MTVTTGIPIESFKSIKKLNSASQILIQPAIDQP